MISVNSSSYIRHLISQGEGIQLDFKYNISSAAKIARSLVAFANTNGGRLLIGVKDNGNITGVKSDEESYMIDLAAERYCRPEIKTTKVNHEIDGKTVLEVIIEPDPSRLYYALEEDRRWLLYVRRADENILANKILLKVLERRATGQNVLMRYDAPEKFILNYLQSYRSISLEDFARLADIPVFVAEKVLINLISLELIQINLPPGDVSYRLKRDLGSTLYY